MNQTNKNIEIKMSVLISLAIVMIVFIVIAKIYISHLNNKVEASSSTVSMVEEENTEVILDEKIEEVDKEVIQDIEEKENNVVEETKEVVNEEPKKITYTASNGKKYDAIATLNIPSLGIEYPILSSTSEALLKVALNKYWGANPNEVGNMVVIGHNYKNSKFFGKLPQIEIGAIVKITDLTGKTLDYKVYDKFIIDPNDNSCTSQLTNGQTEITLITCYYQPGDVHASKRLVVKARTQ